MAKLPKFEPKLIRLRAKVFPLYDAPIQRRYLIEDRPREQRFTVGDLVWIKQKLWPWWPAMVTVHPHDDIYYKYNYSDDSISYHVQHFGPRPYHCWILENKCQPFNGFDQFQQKMKNHIEEATKNRKKTKVIKSYLVPNDHREDYNNAINEAEIANLIDQKVRLQQLTYRYYSLKYERFY
ncbi:Histone-lysine N-methyltransferase NSD3, partial [Blomia tropicalis]